MSEVADPPEVGVDEVVSAVAWAAFDAAFVRHEVEGIDAVEREPRQA